MHRSTDANYLLDVLGRILRFAQRAAERLALLGPQWLKEHTNSSVQLDKVLGEMAVLLLIANRAAHRRPELRPSVDMLGQTLSPLIRSERARALSLRSQRSAAMFRIPHQIMTLSGFPDGAFDQIVERNREGCGHGERVAFRIAESRWLQSLLENSDVVIDDLLPFSVFAEDIDPFEVDRIDLYAVTHWLMYVSDFGLRPVPPSIRAPVIALLDDAIAWQLAAEDLDLLGELVIGAHIADAGWSDHLIAAWLVLTAAWDDLGFVPSPSFQAKEFKALSGESQESYAIANIYHTQFVFGILAALLLQAKSPAADAAQNVPRSPDALKVSCACRQAATRTAAFIGNAGISIPTMPAYPAQKRGSGWEVIAALAIRGKQDLPFWMKAISHMPEHARSRVGVDALLVQGARQYDLDGVAKLVQLVIAASIPPSPVYLRALLWLTRQQTPEGAISAHFVNRDNIRQPEAKVVSGLIGDLLRCAASYLDANDNNRLTIPAAQHH